MGAIGIISLVITLLQSVLTSAKASGVPQEIVTELQAAVNSLLKVQGTDVTYSQLESLRVTTEW